MDHIDPPIESEPIDGAGLLQAFIIITLCLALVSLSLYQADHLQRVLPTSFGYMLALSIVYVCFGGDAFSVDTLINSTNARERIAPCVVFGLSAILHIFMIQSSQLAFAQGGHIQAANEVEQSQVIRDLKYMRSSLTVMMNDTEDLSVRMQLLDRFNRASDKATELEKGYVSSRDKAMATTGQSEYWQTFKAALMIDIAMWIGGLSLGGYRGFRRMSSPEFDGQFWEEEPEPKPEPKPAQKPKMELVQKTMRPKFTERLEVEIEDMMQPRRDNTPGNKRKADYALQFQHAKMNINRINNVEDIKRECKCGQARAGAIRDELIAKGVWKGQSPRRGLNSV